MGNVKKYFNFMEKIYRFRTTKDFPSLRSYYIKKSASFNDAES